MSKLSISIVNFNSGEFLVNCLQSIKNQDLDCEIYVVDNNSADESIEKAKKKFPKVNYILSDENLGFGKAHNLVLKKVKTEYVLILNPDCEIQNGTLKRMISFMDENPEVGVASCKVVLENGSLDKASHRGFPTPIASLRYFLGDGNLYHLTSADMSKSHEVDAISGAFFLTRKKVIDEVGYFDEDYFMYAEDIDLCYRIKNKGYKIMYVPEVEVLHHKGISSGLKKHSQEKTTADLETKERALNAFYETMKIFYKKHYEKNYPAFISWFIYCAINLKWWMAKRKMSV